MKGGQICCSKKIFPESFGLRYRYRSDRKEDLNKRIQNEVNILRKYKPSELDRGDCILYRDAADCLAREAIHVWSLCGKRAGLPRDLRILVGKLLWENKRDFIP